MMISVLVALLANVPAIDAALINASVSDAALVNASVGDAARTISPYLASMSLVYAWAPDVVYGNRTRPNDTMLSWAI